MLIRNIRMYTGQNRIDFSQSRNAKAATVAAFGGRGLHWARTSDLCSVKAAL